MEHPLNGERSNRFRDVRCKPHPDERGVVEVVVACAHRDQTWRPERRDATERTCNVPAVEDRKLEREQHEAWAQPQCDLECSKPVCGDPDEVPPPAKPPCK